MIKFISTLKTFINIIAFISFFGVVILTLIIAMIEPCYGAYPVLKMILLVIGCTSGLYIGFGLFRGDNKKHLRVRRK